LRRPSAFRSTIDYLADDTIDIDPARPGDLTSDLEKGLLRTARDIGTREAAQLLEIAKFVGYETAMRRLLDAKPVIELPPEANRGNVASTPPAAAAVRAS
jgi:hypothetical protein